MSIKHLRAMAILTAFFTLLMIQIGFTYGQKAIASKATAHIKSLFRTEQVASNPFNVSSEIYDLGAQGVIECPILTIPPQTKPYLEAKDMGRCSGNALLLNIYRSKISFESINGEPFILEFSVPSPKTFSIALWLSRLTAVLVAILILTIGIYSSRLLEQKEKTLLAEQRYSQRIFELSRQVAHDVRSPLSAIRLVLGRAGLSQEERELIEASTQRIDKIAEDILVSAKPKAACSLSQVLDSSLKEKRAETSDRSGISLQADIAKTEATYNIDSTQLSRIMSNLLNNAVEATNNDGGQISVELKEHSQFGEITITDNGHGIPEAIKERIWNRGFSHGKHKGHGLGLSHAKETIESWGGTIQIDSKVDQGTRVTIQIPKYA